MTLLPTGVHGPLPEGTVGLLLGRSSSALRGLQVSPGVIDADFTGEIKIMASASHDTIQIKSGQRIAQIILLPLAPNNCKSQKLQARGDAGFGSSNVYWLEEIKKTRPMKTLLLNGKKFTGLLDTGADVTCISLKEWPKNWPTDEADTTLQGLGQAKTPQRSSGLLKWQDEEGNEGHIQPYVVDGLPLSLWGRDVLGQMGVYLFSPDERVTALLNDMRLNPEKGLGKNQQGRKWPVQPRGNPRRYGLGYESQDFA